MDGFPEFAGAMPGAALIVTAAAGGARDGCVVGFATQVSIRPARALVCISEANATFSTALEATHLGVHVVPHDRLDLAQLFGGETGDETDKFERCRWEEGPGGVPLLVDCHLRMAGSVIDRHPLGDHTGFLLDPVRVWWKPGTQALPLRLAMSIEPGHPA
jgi:flavin reductase (DIM6/NTAB) family NADH-FMN oxidoreductase RutF